MGSLGGGRGTRRGQWCFPSEFKVADGGLHGLEWAGSAVGWGAGRRAGKRLFGAPAPGALQSCQRRAEVRGPAPDGCPWLLAGRGRAHTPPPPPPDPLRVHSFREAHPEKPPSDSGPCFQRAPRPRALWSSQHRARPRRSLRPWPSRARLGAPQRVQKPRVLLSQPSPRPRAAAESLTRHLRPVPLAPDRRLDWRVAPRASGWGGRPGRGPGAGTGCRGAAPAPPAARSAVAPTRAHARTFPRAA